MSRWRLTRSTRSPDQRSNQAQKFLLLWPAASTDKKGSKLDIGNLATRGKIRLMPDEHPVGITIDGEQPSITVGRCGKSV
jgi:hypothetical protein